MGVKPSYSEYWNPQSIEQEHQAWLSSVEKQDIAECIMRHVPCAGRVADFCCGTGVQGLRLRDAGFRGLYAPIDKSKACLDHGIKSGTITPPCDVTLADIREGWVEGCEFDVALLIAAQKHQSPEEVFDIMERLANTARYFGVTINQTDKDYVHDEEPNGFEYYHTAIPRQMFLDWAASKGWELLEELPYSGKEPFFLFKVQ